jgi:drug/metabolite transporter (DMT)-like permease
MGTSVPFDLISYSCAALAAGGNALANVMQRKSGLEQPADRPFGPALLWDLVRSPTWLLGFAGLVGSFVLQAVALGYGQLSAVEPIITIEVPLTLLLASRVFGTRLRRLEWSGILIMTLGMIVLLAVLEPKPGNETNVSSAVYAAAGGATAATIALFVVISRRGGALWQTALLGAAAGTSFGLTATLLKETIAEGEADGLIGVLSTWQTYGAVGFGIGGLVLVQWALHCGPLLAAQPGFTLMDPLVSILWGVLVFDESTRSGWWLAPATGGALAIGVGVFMLARSPLLATFSETLPEPRPDKRHDSSATSVPTCSGPS